MDDFSINQIATQAAKFKWTKIFTVFSGVSFKAPQLKELYSAIAQRAFEIDRDIDLDHFLEEDEICNFLTKMFGISKSDGFSPTFIDFRYFNIERLSKVFTLLYLEVCKNEIDIKMLPMRMLAPSVELISVTELIDENDLAVEYWASLLYSAMLDTTRDRMFFTHCLKDLNKEEYVLLEYLFEALCDGVVFHESAELIAHGLCTYESLRQAVTVPWSSQLFAYMQTIGGESFDYNLCLSIAGIEFMYLVSQFRKNILKENTLYQLQDKVDFLRLTN